MYVCTLYIYNLNGQNGVWPIYSLQVFLPLLLIQDFTSLSSLSSGENCKS